MTRGSVARLAAAGLVAGLLARVPMAAQDTGPVVAADVVVTDANGVAAVGLTAADFEVLSDSRVQPVSFAAPEAQPVSVVFLIDVSASAVGIWRPDVSTVVASLAGALRPGERARLGGIAGHVTLGPWSESAAALIGSASSVLTPGREDQAGPSPIWDALDGALDALSPEPGRRTIVLLTDGLASGNVHGLDEVRGKAAARGVSINVITGRTLLDLSAGRFLGQLAQTSGGLALQWIPPTRGTVNGVAVRPMAGTAANAAAYTAQVIGRVLDDLRACYRIGFTPDRDDDAVHTLSVRVRRPGFRVRVREQYVVHGAR